MVKKRLQVTIRNDLVEWIDQEIFNLRFASRSHAIEFAIVQLKKNEENLKRIVPDESMGLEDPCSEK